MTLIDDSFWTLRIDRMRPTPLTPEEPEDFIHELSGKILCAAEDDKDRIAGRFRIYYADFELAANHGVSNFEVLDAHQHTLEYADAILHPAEGPFSARLEKLLGDIWNLNFLILDRVEILPRYRGKGVGLHVLVALMERFGAGAGLVGMKPFPLQFEPNHSLDSSWVKRLRLREMPHDLKSSTQKLKQYYSRLGFVAMRSTPFMFRNMSWTLPSGSCLTGLSCFHA
jgi:GNAT superfamily N-acetyltransferase